MFLNSLILILTKLNLKVIVSLWRVFFFINKHKIPIYEIPIYFEDRTSGKSKLSKYEIIRTLFNLFRLKLYTN